MDSAHFDHLARALAQARPRRALAPLALLVLLGAPTEAKKKKGKGKKGKKHKHGGGNPPTCPEATGDGVTGEAGECPIPCVCFGQDNEGCWPDAERCGVCCAQRCCGPTLRCCGGECCRSQGPQDCCLDDQSRTVCCANRQLTCLHEETTGVNRCCPQERRCAGPARCCPQGQECVKGATQQVCCPTGSGRECPREANGKLCCPEGETCETYEDGTQYCRKPRCARGRARADGSVSVLAETFGDVDDESCCDPPCSATETCCEGQCKRAYLNCGGCCPTDDYCEYRCNTSTADHCANGACRCGDGPACDCARGQTCLLGQCVCAASPGMHVCRVDVSPFSCTYYGGNGCVGTPLCSTPA